MHAPRLGLLLALSLTAMAGLVLVDIVAAEMGRSSETVHGPTEFGHDGFTSTSTVEASGGDVVRIPIPSDLPAPFASYRVVVVAGGTGGNGDATVLAEALGERSLAGRPLYVTVPAGANGVDVVRELGYDRAPPEGQAEIYFREWVRSAAGDVSGAAETTAAWAVTVHRVVVPLLWTLSAATVVLGAVWLRQALASGDTGEAITIVELGVRTLRFLGGLLWWILPALVIGAWAMLIFFWNVEHTLPGFGPDWTTSLRTAIVVLLLAAGGGWMALMTRVTRARRRWHTHEATFPLA